MKQDPMRTTKDRTWKFAAVLSIALMAAFWIYGQDLLDQMALSIMLIALVLPLGAGALCAASWLIRNARRRASGWEATLDPAWRRDQARTIAGLFAVAWVFAFVADRLGHTPHQAFVSAAVASAWDAGGIACILFCGACLVGGGRR